MLCSLFIHSVVIHYTLCQCRLARCVYMFVYSMKKTSSTPFRSVAHALEQINTLNGLHARDEAMFASIGEGAYAIDTDRVITHINPCACEMLGVARDKIIGRFVYDVIPLIDERGGIVPRHERPLEEALLSRRSATFSSSMHPYYLFNNKTKKRFPVVITVSPIIINEEVVGAVSVFRDNTTEYELDRAKNEFISLASHQLRTPLSVMALNVELLERHYLSELGNESIAAHVAEISKASKRMVKLVNTLLNVSRLELGALSTVSSSAHLSVLVDEKVKEFEPLMTERGLSIKKTYETGLPEVAGDVQLLQIVIDNILSNAVKYSYRTSEIEIIVRAQGQYIECVIRNYGYGIPDDAKPYVFSKLFRAGNISDLGEEGTGLGLYIAKSIVERLHGTLSFTSKENDFTTFSIVLPMLQSQGGHL